MTPLDDMPVTVAADGEIAEAPADDGQTATGETGEESVPAPEDAGEGGGSSDVVGTDDVDSDADDDDEPAGLTTAEARLVAPCAGKESIYSSKGLTATLSMIDLEPAALCVLKSTSAAAAPTVPLPVAGPTCPAGIPPAKYLRFKRLLAWVVLSVRTRL